MSKLLDWWQLQSTAKPPLPPIPTRDQVCGIKITFQGLTVNTLAYGMLPWFEAALTSLSSIDRMAVYDAKRAAGDTHCIVALTWQYKEEKQPYYDIPGCDMTENLPRFKMIIEEVVRAGFIPMLFLGGDGQEFNPVGWTYGHDWLYSNLPAIVTAVGELALYCLWLPGWDGVFGNFAATWSRVQIGTFGQLFRSLLPDGFLGLEFSVGYSHLGEGGFDYAPGEPMSFYDVILSEYDMPLGQDSTWQVTARLVYPYRRPFDQPFRDDPYPPFYLITPSLRGRYYHCAFEFAEYYWVRGMSELDVIKARVYLEGLGCTYTG